MELEGSGVRRQMKEELPSSDIPMEEEAGGAWLAGWLLHQAPTSRRAATWACVSRGLDWEVWGRPGTWTFTRRSR